MDVPILRENLIKTNSQKITDVYDFDSTTLGQGSFGFVKVAQKKFSSIKRAIKIVPKRKISNSELLHSEISIMKQVDHPNIIKLFESFEDSEYIYLVMELCEGGELFDKIIQCDHVNESAALDIFKQLLCAVSYLHSINIVHCDLKPQNFLYYDKSWNSCIKLIDFGLAKSMKDRNSLVSCSGTCSYVAPEVLLGPYDKKSDIWSLGVILYMLLSGYLPFDGTSQAAVIQKVLTDPLCFSEPVWEKVSVDAKNLLTNLIERDTSKRFSCEEIFHHPWISSNQNNIPIRLSVKRLKRYQKSQKLKKSVLNFMATQCETDEIKNLAELFLRIDTNSDGHLSLAELRQAFSNKNMNEEEFEELISSLDGDKNGSIDFTEFTAAIIGRGIYLCQEKLWNAFKRFDLNGNGKITPEEIQNVLDSGHFVKDSKVWVDLVKEVDLDGDGTLSFEEFVLMMDNELVK